MEERRRSYAAVSYVQILVEDDATLFPLLGASVLLLVLLHEGAKLGIAAQHKRVWWRRARRWEGDYWTPRGKATAGSVRQGLLAALHASARGHHTQQQEEDGGHFN